MLGKNKQQKLGTFMCLLLRHNPLEFALEFDELGFTQINDFLEAICTQEKWKDVTLEDLHEVVKNCDKQRYEMTNKKIRATYGHSFMRIEYSKAETPKILYHGTHKGVVDKILEEGIKSMGRQYVHTSETTHFASLAGERRGELVLLKIDVEAAKKDGHEFYYAGNEVWLADFVPSKYLNMEE